MPDSCQRDKKPGELKRPDPRFAQEAISRAMRMCDEAQLMKAEADKMRIYLLKQRERIAWCQDRQRVPALSSLDRCFLTSPARPAVQAAAVKAALHLVGADMGNVQLFDPALGALRIEAQCGFDKPFLDFFEYVHDGQSACGVALTRGERVVVDDVTQSPIFVGTPALDVMIGAGARAVQSVPLIGSDGRLLGVFSAHYHLPRRPSEGELHMFDLLAKHMTRWIELRSAC